MRRLTSLSITSLQHQLTGQATEKLVVTSHHEENQVIQLDDMTAEADMEVVEQPQEQAQMASDIRWRYAEQGMNIQRMAYLEKRNDPSFTRKSYIDGLTYMLMALPDNLSDQETAAIREALPPPVADLGLAGGRNDRGIGWGPPPDNRTALQRCIAHFVALLVVLIHLALSYAGTVIRVGAYYERKHNISQHLASKGFIIATAVGRHSVVLSTKICAMKDGRFGRAISSIASWTAESVTYGIQEGIGQGLMMVDTKKRLA
ncbi:hypothetical protein ONZ43_g3293 [Nemania bipapillata]|uniref:Uncharacterized protein n=1 Tax=Nemania bipapillata TaxID=110536 RepID=A0ACC2IXD5_9PEZI|nr:hypothetical protein ONZ43_g3293 [Nemania bipapillata]